MSPGAEVRYGPPRRYRRWPRCTRPLCETRAPALPGRWSCESCAARLDELGARWRVLLAKAEEAAS
jgi:hypothetical protein